MAAKQRTREVTKSHWESRGRLSSSEVFNVPHVRPRGRTLKALNERASSHFTPLSVDPAGRGTAGIRREKDAPRGKPGG